MGRYHPAKPAKPAKPARKGPDREYTGKGHRERAQARSRVALENALLGRPESRAVLLAAEAAGARAVLAALPDAPAPGRRHGAGTVLPVRGVDHRG